jgi:uncharacterized membrane protein YgcG
MDDIERELEQTLHRVLDPISARPIPPRRAVHGRSAFRTVAGGAGAALTVKLLTGVAAAAAAVTVAGAVTTGSLNPVNWGEAVTARVQACKSDIASNGQQGIGDCVSDLASTHGATVSNAARHHGNPNATNNGNSGNNGNNGNSGNNGGGSSTGNNGANGHGSGKSQSHPTPPPKSKR